MKNNYSLAERNRIVEEYLPYVDQVIRRNRALMRTARLEYDDVFQQLSLRLVCAVSTYDPDKGALGVHIWAQLRFELLSCKAPRRLCGMTELPWDFRRENIISFDSICEGSEFRISMLADSSRLHQSVHFTPTQKSRFQTVIITGRM